ncbi:MAG: [FeFe] hydrogenase H-cluster radical SAM maturase HydE [Clostridiales bacterium]|nr:[FeFe] hydrogenase H-cluster radical SAM maturase HydE [Clostridiales bacterium]
MPKQHTEICNELIGRLSEKHVLSYDEYLFLIKNRELCRNYIYTKAESQRNEIYGNKFYIRGLIEFTNYCKNNCLYCGIRQGNSNASRYRLSKKEIIDCADYGYKLGFRTFVLQGGEDPFYTDEILCVIVSEIKRRHPDCAVTLSVGERSFESYKTLKNAGADRYLLRHETANELHYKKIHPREMNFKNRLNCLEELKSLGYQVGAGFMVGSPYQTEDDLAYELIFLKNLNPHMVGIGPFIPHNDTPFADMPAGTAELTLFVLALIRLTLPNVLLPATTALGTIDPFGREKAVRAGANVVMPNLSPVSVRKKYMLYNNKICTGDEAAQCIECLKKRIESTGCEIVVSRGDYRK